MPTKSFPSNNRSVSEEWFVRVWYAVDNNSQKEEVKMEISALVILEYLFVRYSLIFHLPIKRTITGIK